MILTKIHENTPIAQELHLSISDQSFDSPDLAARHFRLKEIGEAWRAVDEATAKAILLILLRKDMAYSLPRIPEELVQVGANEFLAHFSSKARFYTNGTWPAGMGWMPVTNATFDGGILVLDADSSGVLWLEDED